MFIYYLIKKNIKIVYLFCLQMRFNNFIVRSFNVQRRWHRSKKFALSDWFTCEKSLIKCSSFFRWKYFVVTLKSLSWECHLRFFNWAFTQLRLTNEEGIKIVPNFGQKSAQFGKTYKFWLWEISVQAMDEPLSYFNQSKTRARAHE